MPAEANAGGITGNDSALGTYLNFLNKQLNTLISKKKGSLNDWLFNRNFCYMEESLRAKRFFGMCVFSGAQ